MTARPRGPDSVLSVATPGEDCYSHAATDGDTDAASVPVLETIPVIKALFVGPLALESMVEKYASTWSGKIQDFYGVELDVAIATPPFETDDLDVKGYWLNPVARDHEKRVRQLKSEVSKALVSLLIEVEK